MDFRPKDVIFQKNPDGSSTRFEVWNYDTLAGVELFGMIANLLWMIFLVFLVGPYLLFISIMMFCGRFNFLNIIGGLFSIWVLYDAYNGGLLICGMNIIFNEKVFNYIVIINVISLVLNIFLSIFGTLTHKLIVKNIDLEKTRITIFSWILFILALISYIITVNNLESKPGWMRKNIDKHLNDIAKPQEVKDSLDYEIEMDKNDVQNEPVIYEQGD